MLDNPIPLIAIVGFALVGVYQWRVSQRRHRLNYREYLEPVLGGYGVKFVSAVFPGAFNVGPFPKIERIDGPEILVNGRPIGYLQYRIVSFDDEDGNRHCLWALLHFEYEKLKSLRWRVDEQERPRLPEGLSQLIEN
jgi:hypothetical protein